MIQPLGKRILVEAIKEEKKQGIIITTDTAPQKFKVTAIGDEVKKVNVGDTLFLGSFATSEFTLDGIKHILVNEENIIAKVI